MKRSKDSVYTSSTLLLYAIAFSSDIVLIIVIKVCLNRFVRFLFVHQRSIENIVSINQIYLIWFLKTEESVFVYLYIFANNCTGTKMSCQENNSPVNQRPCTEVLSNYSKRRLLNPLSAMWVAGDPHLNNRWVPCGSPASQIFQSVECRVGRRRPTWHSKG